MIVSKGNHGNVNLSHNKLKAASKWASSVYNIGDIKDDITLRLHMKSLHTKCRFMSLKSLCKATATKCSTHHQPRDSHCHMQVQRYPWGKLHLQTEARHTNTRASTVSLFVE